MTGSGGKAIAVPTDVTHCDQVERLIDANVQTYGRIDVMINNVGLNMAVLTATRHNSAIPPFPPTLNAAENSRK